MNAYNRASLLITAEYRHSQLYIVDALKKFAQSFRQ